jgi:hypothetical protein
MGLLSHGTPLDWAQAKPYADHVRYHGISQFLNTWGRLKDRQGDELLWGDEVPLHRLSAIVTHRPLIARPPADRVYGRATRPRYQRCRTLSLPNRYPRQVAGPQGRFERGHGSLVSFYFR